MTTDSELGVSGARLWPGLRTMISGSWTHRGPAAAAMLAGLVNGATMVLAAAAIGWSTDPSSSRPSWTRTSRDRRGGSA